MKAPIDKPRLASEKAKLQDALENARATGLAVKMPAMLGAIAVDRHLDAVLRASGSALKHFSMHKTLAEMRTAMCAAMIAGSSFSISAAAHDVIVERRRQVAGEDWTQEHDDAHPNGQIAAFAAIYAMPPAAREWPATETGYGKTFGSALCPVDWSPKFGDRRRELVKAGALILAEIERLDRAAATKDA